MGFMDGAVNGMATRLVAAGFAPDEAYCLGQAAYIKEGKRDPGVPRAEVDRQTATAAINHALSTLGQFPMAETHRQRIRLWERIFGFRSWPEPIDPEEVYSPMELLARGYSVPPRVGTSGTVAAPAEAIGTTDDSAEWTFRVVMGSRLEGEFIDQMTDALRRAAFALQHVVEKDDYVWNEDDADYSIFTKGDDEMPEWVPGRALDSYPLGAVCATGIVTARKR